MKTIEGGLTSPSAHIAIVVSRFNMFINQHLLSGAVGTLQRVGQIKEDDITVVWVPGAYEIPLAAKQLAESGKFDGIVALGTVIRGETVHFDFVAGESSSGLLKISLDYSIPIGFGILTTETTEQAIERAGNKAGNKGADAAQAVLEMVNVLKAIKG